MSGTHDIKIQSSTEEKKNHKITFLILKHVAVHGTYQITEADSMVYTLLQPIDINFI